MIQPLLSTGRNTPSSTIVDSFSKSMGLLHMLRGDVRDPAWSMPEAVTDVIKER